jgi:hypothetical protein
VRGAASSSVGMASPLTIGRAGVADSHRLQAE